MHAITNMVGVFDDPLRVARDGSPGRDRRARSDGALHEARPHRRERPPARLRAHSERGGEGVPGRDGCCCQLRLGQPVNHDFPRATGSLFCFSPKFKLLLLI